MLAISIVVGIFTLLIALVLLSKSSFIDGLVAAAICVWSSLLMFGGITNPTGYLVTLVIYFGIGGLLNLYKADSKKDGTFFVASLIYLALAGWALYLRLA